MHAHSEITSVLKVALKSRGVTYAQLASKLDVSEKTIKRLFQEKDCSLSRLGKICEAINLSLYDLFDFAKQYAEPPASLTHQQEVYLCNHPMHMSFLFFLTIGHSAEQIQKEYALSEVSLFRYLRDLDKHGFIELGAENAYRLLVNGKLLLPLHGPLHDFIKSKNKQFLDYAADHHGEPGVSFRAAYRYMSKESLQALNEDVVELHNKYIKLASRDEAVLSRDHLLPVKWVTMVAAFKVFGRWEVGELEE